MARYALVVGISQYEEPFEMLSKAITDANAVADLLKQDKRYQSVEVLAGEVTGAKLVKALKTFLQERAAKNEALIYFTGHGFTVVDIAGETEGYLATSDCSVTMEDGQATTQKGGLPLSSFNKLIQASDLSNLIVLLDTCHSGAFLEQELIKQSFQAFGSRTDYYLITGCRSFEEGNAKKREKHSVFTGALLGGLSQENVDEQGKVTGDRLFDFVYTELHGSKQEPIRMGIGRAIAIVEYKLILQPPSGMVALEEMANLLAILQLQNIEKYIQQSYTKYVSQDHQLELDRSLSAILEQLNTEFPNRDGKPQRLFEFVNDLIGNSNIPTLVRYKLQSWASSKAQSYGVNLVITPPDPVTPYLLIRLQPSKQQENCFFVKAWSFLDDQSKAEYSQLRPLTSQKFPEEQAYPFEKISAILNDLLDQIHEEIQNTEAKVPIIEFFLPEDYLCTRVDQLTFLDGMGIETPISMRYQVVVRSCERLDPRYRKFNEISWREKWNQIKKWSPASHKDLFECLNQVDGYSLKSLRASLAKKIGLQLISPPVQSQLINLKSSSNKDLRITALLCEAIPIAIWPSYPISEAAFVEVFDKFFTEYSLLELPEYIHSKRLEAIRQETEDHIGQYLVLLWEDPDRLPPNGNPLKLQTA